MINECSRDDDIEKKKLIKYAADWWAGQIMLKKAAYLSHKDDDPISKRLAKIAEKQITDESLDKFIFYFSNHAENQCRTRLDVDYEPNCLFLRECFEYAGIKTFFFAPKKTRTFLNIEQGFFAYHMEEDKGWTIRAKTKYCNTDFGSYFNTFEECLYPLEEVKVSETKTPFDVAYSEGVKAVIEKLDEIIEPMDSFTKPNYDYLAKILKSNFNEYLEK